MSLLSDLVPMGTSGYSGYSGYSGNSGSSGYSAYSGYSGYSAYSGTSGYSGYSGYSSTSGVSGYSAYSGVSGTSGYSGAVGSTPTTIDVTVTAGEALSARDCCYIAPVTGGGLTAGRAYKADADTVRQSTQGFWCGFATAAINAAATGTVRVAGVLTGFTLTAGAPQYISATAGAITETAPTNSRLVGIALDTTNLLINTRGANTTVTKLGIKGYVLNDTAANNCKVTYSTDTTSALTTIIGPTQPVGVSDGVTKGYSIGLSSTYKITFATDVSSASTATAGPTIQAGGLSASNSVGFHAGGYTGATVLHTQVSKITYSTDVLASITTAAISQARRQLGACNNFNVKGYLLGGYATGSARVATSDKLTYSNETAAASTTSNLSAARGSNPGQLSEGTTKGYYFGGNTGNPVTTADKITFSSDVTSAVTTANLTEAKDYHTSLSEGSSKGFILGGYSSHYANATNTDKITFSTDVTAAATTANMPTPGPWLSGVSDVAV